MIEFTKLPVYQEMRVDMFAMASTINLEVFEMEMYDAMLHRMKAYVLAEEVENRTLVSSFEVKVPLTWWDFFKQERFPNWLLNRFPAKQRIIKKKKTVKFTKYATYPKATMTIPDKVGNTIVYRSSIYEL